MAAPSDVINPITTDFFVKGAVNNATEYSIVMSKLKDAGGFETIEGGENYTWPVETGLSNVVNTNDGADLSAEISPDTIDIQATLPFADKVATAAMTAGMIRKNRGNPALASYKERIVPTAVRSLLHEGTSSAKYDFLNSNGSSKTMRGLPDVFRFDTGSSDQEATVTSGATYAGQSLEAGGLAAEVSQPIDDYIWTPRGVNTAYTAWTGDGTTTTGFVTATALEIIDYTQLQITFDPSRPEMRPDALLSNKAEFKVLRNVIGSNQTFYIDGPGKFNRGAGEWAVGTSSDTLYYDGLDVCWDAQCPSGVLYMVNTNQIKLVSQKGMEDIDTTGMVGKLFRGESDGIALEFLADVLLATRSIGTLITLPGQWVINPRYQAKIASFA